METQAARHVLVKQTHTGALARLWKWRLLWRSVWRCVKSSHCLPTAPVISAWTCFAAFSIKFALGVLVHYVGFPHECTSPMRHSGATSADCCGCGEAVAPGRRSDRLTDLSVASQGHLRPLADLSASSERNLVALQLSATCVSQGGSFGSNSISSRAQLRVGK